MTAIRHTWVPYLQIAIAEWLEVWHSYLYSIKESLYIVRSWKLLYYRILELEGSLYSLSPGKAFQSAGTFWRQRGKGGSAVCCVSEHQWFVKKVRWESGRNSWRLLVHHHRRGFEFYHVVYRKPCKKFSTEKWQDQFSALERPLSQYRRDTRGLKWPQWETPIRKQCNPGEKWQVLNQEAGSKNGVEGKGAWVIFGCLWINQCM